MARFHLIPSLSLFLALGAASCSSSGAELAGEGFTVSNISVANNELNWRINRPIDISFSADVDFSTVGLNTIRIADLVGRPATGLFIQPLGANGTVDPRVVRFQPACPTQADSSDAGFRPGGVQYVLTVVAANNGFSVRSTSGEPLGRGESVRFRTPVSSLPSELFVDTVPGPPRVVLRGQDGVETTEAEATYHEDGGDGASRTYFEFDPTTQTGQLPAGFEVPLNKYGEPDTRVAVLVFINQPLQPLAENFGSQRVRLEFSDPRNIAQGDPLWEPIPTDSTLVGNCTGTGALLRLEPKGILPQGAFLRVILGQGFADLTGDALDAPSTQFARMQSRIALDPVTGMPGADTDDFLDSFLIGGSSPDSLQDTSVASAVPPADWGGGTLTASFAFGGTGGTNGSYDWTVANGATVIIDTVSSSITGPSGTQAVIGGRLDVRDLTIPSTSQVIFQGPNPAVILASGTIRIAGEISVRGSDSQGVSTLGTTNFPELGAVGQCGGGNGGVGSFLTSQSTPRGGDGFGAFNGSGGGGQGGESCFHPSGTNNDRRAGGGGGGRLGLDIYYPFPDSTGLQHFVKCQTLVGMDAEVGRGGSANGTSAVTQNFRAMGGQPSPFPFVDGNDENDFFGAMLVNPGQPGERLILGELDRVWAGAGGGAGGDAITSSVFPPPFFNPSGDEKGSGGGGGAGGLSIFAIGPIIVADGGRIVVDGGNGGGGENSLFFDRVGGGSGGGSGGHIVMSSANYIEINGSAANSGPYYGDPFNQTIHTPRAISALGGQGGAGHGGGTPGDRGGAGNRGETTWACDSISKVDLIIPVINGMGNMETLSVPPNGLSCFSSAYPAGQHDQTDPLGPSLAAGGDGGPGIVQLHVDNPALNLRFPNLQSGDVGSGFTPAYGEGLDVTRVMAPPPLGWNGLNDADQMVPLFGAQSVAQSRWVPLGLARINPDPGEFGNFLADDQVRFGFVGTDVDGAVETDVAGNVVLQPAVLGPDLLSAAPDLPYIVANSGGSQMVLDAQTLKGTIYTQSEGLLRGFVLRLESAASNQDFSIESASYDALTEQYTVTVSTAGGTLADLTGAVSVSLIPHYFRVATNGVVDRMPPDAAIAVFFDATKADSSGDPNPDLAYSVQLDGMGLAQGFTSDVAQLNADEWDFFRFRVEFNLNTTGSGVDLTTPRPAFQFLRVPFEY